MSDNGFTGLSEYLSGMDRFKVKYVPTLNDLPDGKRLVIKNKFVIIATNAIYEINGNRMKLKRAWSRPQLNPDGN